MQTLTFQNIALTPAKVDNQIWLSSTDLAKSLGYAETDSVTKIYNRNKDEFTSSMTTTVKMTVVRKTGKVEMDNRIFSLRGCHLIAMFARTAVAKDFRKWVLDILDREVGAPVQRHTISIEQQAAIQKCVRQKCQHNSTHYQTLYHALYDEFGITSYKELLASDFDNAMAFIANCHLKVDSCLHNDAIARNLHNLVWHTMHIYQWYKERENAFFALSPTIAGGVHDHIIHAKGCANALQRAFDGDYSKRLM